jgi:hypothetical protein
MQGLGRFWKVGHVLALVVGLSTQAAAQDVETVIEWQRILQTTVVGTPTPTVFFTRPYAMTSVAMFDAVNSIDRVYQPYFLEVAASPGASRAAAAAQAAHDVLVALYPGQTAALDAALANTLGRLPASGVADGVRVGAAAARATLDGRASDRWDARPTEYLVPALPGYYQVTPPGNTPATFTHYPDVQPFVVGSRLQLLVAPPPALTSELYTADFEEVKRIGSVNSAARTEEQTSIARRWAGVNTSTQTWIVWGNVVRDLARRASYSAVDTTRAYALLYIAVHDGLLGTFSGKFLYGLWRPVTAIRNADQDGNPATAPDPSWLPLLSTPTYPAYPGNISCICAVAAKTLEGVFGRDDIAFSVTWTGTAGNPDITRSFNGFRHLADEGESSRIFGGIHFRFDHRASFGVCTDLGEYTVANYLRRR